MYQLKKKLPIRLAEAMKMRGMNQKMLSDATGIKAVTVSGYMTGRYEPRRDKLKSIAEALQVSETWLAGLDDEMEAGGKMQSIDCLGEIYSGMTVYDIKTAKKCIISHINRETEMLSVSYPFKGKHKCHYVKFEENRFFIA